MPKDKRTKREPTVGKLYREVAYLHQDEAEGLEKAAEQMRCSKSEVIRRALRAFLGIED